MTNLFQVIYCENDKGLDPFVVATDSDSKILDSVHRPATSDKMEIVRELIEWLEGKA